MLRSIRQKISGLMAWLTEAKEKLNAAQLPDLAQALLAEIEAGRVAIAITKDLSRLGRNSALTGLCTNFTFPENGVRFIAINDSFDTAGPRACSHKRNTWIFEDNASGRLSDERFDMLSQSRSSWKPRSSPCDRTSKYKNDKTRTLRNSSRRHTSMWA